MNRTKTEIDDFLKKSTVLQQTIKGLAEGSINEDQIDLREHGIYTPEQQKQEDERKAKARKEWEARQEQKKIEEREEEKRHWWAGATYFYGPVIGEDTEEGRDVSEEVCRDIWISKLTYTVLDQIILHQTKQYF